MNIYKVTYTLDSQVSDSFLVDGDTIDEAADKVVRLLIDMGVKVPCTVMVKVKRVKYNGRDYVEVEEENDEI